MVYVIFFILLLLVMVFSYLDKGKIKYSSKYGLVKENNKYLFIFFFMCAMLISLRSIKVGVDTTNYFNHFENIKEINFSQIKTYSDRYAIEIGYIFLMKLSSLIFNSYYFFQFLIGSIFSYLMYKFYKKNSLNHIYISIAFLGLSILLFSFNIQRQMLAVAIVLNAYNYAKEGRWGKTLFYIFLASFIHTTAVIFLTILFAYVMRKNKIILSVIIFSISIFVFNFKKIISIMSIYLPHYANYFKNSKVIQSAGLVKLLWLFLIVLAIYEILYSMNKKYQINFDSTYIDFLNIYSIFTICYVVANILGLEFNYFERLGLYFLPFVLLFLERFGIIIKSNSIRNLYYFISSLIFIIYFFISVFYSKQYNYEFYFF